MEIKDEYNKVNFDNSLDFNKWLDEVNPYYLTIFDCLQVNQKDELLLIRYGLADMQKGMWTNVNSGYKECRSIVIDLLNESIVVSPFRKFFNLNEVKENSLDEIRKEIKKADNIEITNKLDGSMQSARFYNGEYKMFGSMALDKDDSWRLKEGFSMLKDNYKLMLKENQDLTFIFEYISLLDCHVVLYNKNQQGLYLIGIRNTLTGEQFSYKKVKEYADKYSILMTEIENKNFEDILNETKLYKSCDKEGWVINIDGHMLKLKCDDYTQIFKVLDSTSSINTILYNIAYDKYDDMISKLPINYRCKVEYLSKKIFDYIYDIRLEVNKAYDNIYCKEDTKRQFMEKADKLPSRIRPYVKNIYLGQDWHPLIRQGGSVKKLSDLGLTYDQLIDGFNG